MAVFYFLNRDRNDSFEDFLEADTLEEAKAVLEDRNIRFSNIRSAGLLDFQFDMTAILGVSPQDLLLLTQFFTALCRAGIPIIKSVELLKANADSITMKRAMGQIQWNIQKGYTITDAFKSQKNIFPPWYVNLLEIGETSGELVQSLERITNLLDRQIQLKRQIIRAMVYPILTVCMSGFLILYLLVFIVPRFKEIYSRFGKDLPLPTQILIGASDTLLQNYIAVGSSLGLLFIFIFFFRNSRIGKTIWNYIQLDLPLFGPIYLTYNTALLSKNLNTLLSAGMQIINSLESVANGLDNYLFKSQLQEAKPLVEEGYPLAAALRKTDRIIPKLAISMIEIGEESGNLPQMLDNLAEYYHKEVENKIAVMTSMIEPILLISLGVVIGGIVISLYLPIFGLAKLMSGN